MGKTRQYIVASLVFALALPLTVVAVGSPPAIPLLVYGDVTLNGASASVGTVVSIQKDNVEIASTTLTTAGKYSIQIPASYAGSTLVYKFGGNVATQKVAANPTTTASDRINLTFGSAPSGGSGGTTSTATASVTSTPTSVTTTTPTPSATPTPTTPTTSATPTAPVQGQVLGATVYNFTQNLSVGLQGADVMALQQHLTDEGLYTGPITGYFGALTKTAVMAFQKEHDIAQTGTVGPLTRTELSKGTAPSSTGTVLVAATYTFTKNLAVGSRDAEVTALQQYLLGNKFFGGPVTGYFGQLTRTAVMAFQKAHGIAQTGTVGPLTRAELNKGVTVVGDVVSSAPSHSALTAEQVNSIITMIQAFGADAATMAKVQEALAQ